MTLPETTRGLPFNVTRASHVELLVGDVARSVEFYTEVIGLVVTERDADAAYLRGMEESCHHSLVVRGSDRPGECAWMGFRVFEDDELVRLADHLEAGGAEVDWAQAPHQGMTLHASDPAGVPLELCAHMPVQPRLLTRWHRYRGGGALRLDHFQLHVPAVERLTGFYTSLGFRISEYVCGGDDDLVAVFLQRKGNPHDIVLFNGPGPRLHHVAYTTTDTHSLLRACDVAGELGYGREVERGPGRHGPGHALFTYFRDPDGHRVELFTTHYQTLDADDEPVRWDAADPAFGFPWGLPAQRTWHEEASPFVGVPASAPAHEGGPLRLEDYLSGLRG